MLLHVEFVHGNLILKTFKMIVKYLRNCTFNLYIVSNINWTTSAKYQRNSLTWPSLATSLYIFFWGGGGRGGGCDSQTMSVITSDSSVTRDSRAQVRLSLLLPSCYLLNYPKTKSQQDSLRLKFWSLEDVSVKVFISLRLPKTISRVFKRGRIGFTIFYHEQL